jgi:hypothetical protein
MGTFFPGAPSSAQDPPAIAQQWASMATLRKINARRNCFDLSGLGSSFVNSLAIPGVFVRKGNDSERAAQNQK